MKCQLLVGCRYSSIHARTTSTRRRCLSLVVTVTFLPSILKLSGFVRRQNSSLGVSHNARLKNAARAVKEGEGWSS